VKILTFSTLYPNNIQKRHGIFVETRLRHLESHTQVKSIVVAPVPWMPSALAWMGEKGNLARVARLERRFDIEIHHPRYLVIPKIGMIVTPFFLAFSSYLAIRKIIRSGYHFDVLDAHYFYPDGIAAIMLGKLLKKPVVVTARGTDLNLIPEFAIPRKMIQWAMKNAGHMITVCEALRQQAIELGAEPDKITTLRNGVDLELFTPPQDRSALRKKLGIEGQTLISVGHLIERKGHHLIIEALQQFTDVNLLIAGDGEEEANLKDLCQKLGVDERVRFLGALSQSELKDYYGASDALVLASSREGWANVLLESMACGSPVIATRVWGTPELVTSTEVGLLFDRNVESLINAIRTFYNSEYNRQTVRAYSERFDWLPISKGQLDIFTQLEQRAH
jgi:teichuronic acid biosynthesis glycosyltransferase TuaC